MRVLVTGGVRSGKSAHAEQLLAGRGEVTYVATGPEPSGDDPVWAERVRAHQARRPTGWTTARDVPPAGPVLLDSLGPWVAARLDELDGWTTDTWQAAYDERVTALVTALAALDDLVVVSDEVGLGGVGAEPGTRLFADLLGALNQRVAAVCDEVHLVVAGRVLRL